MFAFGTSKRLDFTKFDYQSAPSPQVKFYH